MQVLCRGLSEFGTSGYKVAHHYVFLLFIVLNVPYHPDLARVGFLFVNFLICFDLFSSTAANKNVFFFFLINTEQCILKFQTKGGQIAQTVTK